MDFEEKLHQALHANLQSVEVPAELKDKILGKLNSGSVKTRRPLKKAVLAACVILLLAFPSLALGGYTYLADQIWGSIENFELFGGTRTQYQKLNDKLVFASKVLEPSEYSRFKGLVQQLTRFWREYPEGMSKNKEFDISKLPVDKQKEYLQVRSSLEPFFVKLSQAEAKGFSARSEGPQVVVIKVPRSYTLTEKAIVGNQWDEALKHLDITIKESPGSKHAFQARVIRSIIYLSRARAYEDQATAYTEAAKSVVDRKDEFHAKSEVSKQHSFEYMKLLEIEMKQVLKDFRNERMHLYFRDYPNEPKEQKEGAFDWVAEFALNGSENDRNRVLAERMNFNFALYTLYATGHSNDPVRGTALQGRVVYPAYFSLMGDKLFKAGSETKATGRESLGQALLLTQDDEKNVYRIRAKETLAQIAQPVR